MRIRRRVLSVSLAPAAAAIVASVGIAGTAAAATAVDVPRGIPCAGAGAGTACDALIPDAVPGTPGQATSTLTVSDAGVCLGAPLLGVSVYVDLLHSHIGDLRIDLQPPGGVFATVMDRPAQEGGAAGSCAGDDVRALFATGASVVGCDGLVIPEISGVVAPVASLPDFATGTWTLRITDLSPGGIGRLVDWSVVLRCDLPDVLLSDGFEAP